MKTFYLLFLSLLLSAAHAQQWSQHYLSAGRFYMGAATEGDYVMFAGGAINGLLSSNIVDLYQISTNTWSQFTLTQPRSVMSALGGDGKIFLAGGTHINQGIVFQRVDIFDLSTQSWSQSNLSQARYAMMAAKAGGKLFFAGGCYQSGVRFGNMLASKRVDIYDLQTGTWSIDSLSEPRFMGTAVASGDKVYFAGGGIDDNTFSKRVDIYDLQTGSWSIDSLSKPRLALASAAVGDKVLFVGGQLPPADSDDRVDILDVTTGQWQTTSLILPRAMIIDGAVLNGKAYFCGGGRTNWSTKLIEESFTFVEIYDAATGLWSYTNMPTRRTSGSNLTVGNEIWMAGGYDRMIGLTSAVDVYRDTTRINTASQALPQRGAAVYPNPATERLFVQLPEAAGHAHQYALYDMAGRIVRRGACAPGPSVRTEIGLQGLAPGLYRLCIYGPAGMESRAVLLE